MSTCTVFKVGKFYHYRFQINGKRTHKTTRERKKDRADVVAAKAYRDAITRANGGEPIPTLLQLIDEWLLVHGPTVGRAHVERVERFARLHLYGLGDVPIDQLNTARVEQARLTHMNKRRPGTVNQWLATLKLLVYWAVRREVLPHLPWKLAMLRVQKRPKVTLPLGVVDRWFGAIDAAVGRNKSEAIAIRLMFGLGLRESEAGSARWEWIDWERRTYTPGVTKGKEADPIDMPDWLHDFLLPRRRAAGLITYRTGGRPLAKGYARSLINKANKACNLHGITPHRLRGTFATALSEEGVPVQEIQALMRHKDIRTTLGYLENRKARAKTAQNRIGEKAGLSRSKSGER